MTVPTYEYRCTRCKRKFEKLQSMTETPVRKCPRCGGRPERLIGAGAGLIFKGTGFYATDYKQKSAKSGSEPAAAKPKAPESKT